MDDLRRRTLEVNDATYAAWNAHDADAVAAVFADDAVVYEIGGAGESRGRLVIEDVHLSDVAGLMAQLSA